MTARRAIHAVNPAGWLVVLAAVGLWQVLVDTKVLDLDYLPAPSGVAEGFGKVYDSGELASTIGHTLGTTVAATAVALTVGVLGGALIGAVPQLRVLTLASLDVLRTLPVVALMPVTLLVWGPSATSELVVAAWSAMWPVLINTAGGVAAVHARLHDVAASFRLTPLDKLRKITIPAAMPQILVGARLAVINALIVGIVAEMLINPQGLGWALVKTSQGLQPEQMWAWAVITGVIGYLLNAILVRGVRLALPGASTINAGTAA
jgi:sulfonate transport system permease protein